MSAGRFKTYPDCEASRVADSTARAPSGRRSGRIRPGIIRAGQNRDASCPSWPLLDGARAYCLVGRPAAMPGPPSVPLFQPSRSRLAYRRVTCGPRRPARSPCAAPRPQPVAAPPAAPPRQARIQRPQAEVPGSNGGALAHLVDQRAQRAEAISTRSPIAWVKPLPGPCRSCVGENMVPRNSMQPSGYWWCAPRVWRTRSSGSRLIWLIRFTPASEKPSGPSMRSATSAARTLSRVKSASNSRMKGPMAQEPLLSWRGSAAARCALPRRAG